jgi:hypothetical protein
VPSNRRYFRAEILCPKSKRGFNLMKAQVLIASVLVATLSGPLVAQAQGVPGGVALGGVIGGIEGVLGVNHYQTASSEQPYSEQPYSERPHKSARHHKIKISH